MPLTLKVNGKTEQLEVDTRTTLLDALRENLHLFGTKKGCDHGQCGACTVLVNGRRLNACLTLAVMHQGAEITTIEGLAKDGKLHPMQEAFRECHGLQCGFCTPGMVMAATALVAQYPHPDERQVREQLDGNLCRCTGYHNIVRAVLQGAEAMAAAEGEDASLQSLAAARAHAA